MSVVVVVGNPRSGSRTRHAAELIARRLSEHEPIVIELAEIGPALLTGGDDTVERAKAKVHSAGALLVASPTYKATYTGLLKLFLEQFGAGELDGKPTLSLMLGGSYHHALAPEVFLKPVLSEIGCSCLLPGLFLLDSAWRDDPAVEEWTAKARRVLHRFPRIE